MKKLLAFGNGGIGTAGAAVAGGIDGGRDGIFCSNIDENCDMELWLDEPDTFDIAGDIIGGATEDGVDVSCGCGAGANCDATGLLKLIGSGSGGIITG